MSNTRHSNGQVPAALGGTPPSPEVAGQDFADVVGRTVAVHLAQMLGQLLPQVLRVQPWQLHCQSCTLAAKKVARDHQVAVLNARAAGEPEPPMPEQVSVNMAMTVMPSAQSAIGPDGRPVIVGVAQLPVCWEHVQLPEDGPRPTGLVTGAGQPVLFTGQ